ncbi:hypothetical protein QBC37DRAFT_395623 [Rhypophila decipiens]|uniref:Uncharacterized protein n=1 Tax=Rhypophila decipiens TaxID=261697 RepID=A0AAN6YJ08_9PEZI|nr:hypothetical protein QBC37DRAFT_395623 [Rhypophila decipiens]
METFAWSVLPDMRYEILWKYSGAWPSISHVESAVEEALQIEERRSTSTNRPNLKIEMEVIPLGGIRLLEFIHKLQVDVGTLEGNSRELELKVQRQQAKIEAMEQDMLKLKTSLEDRDTMESKLKDAIEDRDKRSCCVKCSRAILSRQPTTINWRQPTMSRPSSPVRGYGGKGRWISTLEAEYLRMDVSGLGHSEKELPLGHTCQALRAWMGWARWGLEMPPYHHRLLSNPSIILHRKRLDL